MSNLRQLKEKLEEIEKNTSEIHKKILAELKESFINEKSSLGKFTNKIILEKPQQTLKSK